MTRKTVAELEARLSTGDSSDDSIAATCSFYVIGIPLTAS